MCPFLIFCANWCAAFAELRCGQEWESSLAFQKEERVLALFPETTEFYMVRFRGRPVSGIVLFHWQNDWEMQATVSSSAKRRKERDYVLAFDDDEGATHVHISTNFRAQSLMSRVSLCSPHQDCIFQLRVANMKIHRCRN